MSSDLESRGFGLEASRTCRGDRSARLLLVMALAPHRAVSTGMRDAAVHPVPAEKNLTEPARRSCPPPDLALRPRPAPHSAPIPRPVVLGGTDGWQRPATEPPGQAAPSPLYPAGRAQVAQLVEQRTENPRVGGSSPPLGTIPFQGLSRSDSRLLGLALGLFAVLACSRRPAAIPAFEARCRPSSALSGPRLPGNGRRYVDYLRYCGRLSRRRLTTLAGELTPRAAQQPLCPEVRFFLASTGVISGSPSPFLAIFFSCPSCT